MKVSANAPVVGFPWNRLECLETPLNLGLTVASGQNFRWRQDTWGIWWGTIAETVVAAWQEPGEPESPVYWQTFPETDQEILLRDYFRLDVDLDGLTAAWIRSEPQIAASVAAFRGLRILRQPPVECFFAFQCAVCNNVVKIERSVHRLAARYGEPIDTRLPDAPFAFYAFPTLEALAHAEEAALRADLWGYRAPRVIHLAEHLLEKAPGWLEALRQAPYAEAKMALTELFGVGEKLADCICLFSLDKDQAVPVDTHVRQIACRLFLPTVSGKSLTPRIYALLADCYRSRFGDFAGWAQQYLFFGELRRARDFQ